MLGPGALAPHQIVVDTHARAARTTRAPAAEQRLVAALQREPDIIPSTIAAPAGVPADVARQANLVDADGR